MGGLSRRAVLGAGVAALLAPVARAQEVTIGDLRITTPWTRAARQGGTGAGYMLIRNTGRSADRLVAARAAIAQTVELHTHVRDGDVMRMRPVEAIDLPPGHELRFAPGALHLMLIGLQAPLRQGEHVPVTLVFERAGEVQVQLSVESAGARGPGGGHGHRH